MKITETKAIHGVERVAASDAPPPPPRDRVTVSESHDVRAAITTAQGSAARTRPARLKDLETQVRAGQYHPDPSRVAAEILEEAEIEARLQALLRR